MWTAKRGGHTMPEETYTIEITKEEVMDLVRTLTDISLKRLDLLKELSEDSEELELAYLSIEHFGISVLKSVLDKCPKELVTTSWKLRVSGKWVDRYVGEDEEDED
jgi:hypothetical protein